MQVKSKTKYKRACYLDFLAVAAAAAKGTPNGAYVDNAATAAQNLVSLRKSRLDGISIATEKEREHERSIPIVPRSLVDVLLFHKRRKVHFWANGVDMKRINFWLFFAIVFEFVLVYVVIPKPFIFWFCCG